MLSFVVYFYLSSYLPLWWDQYLAPYQMFDLSDVVSPVGALIGVVVYEGLVYFYHRAVHVSDGLFRVVHQMHHSAERVDSWGAFYFGPLDMVGFTFLGSMALVVGVGLSPQDVTLFLFATLFLGIFQHMNVRTPRWLGYVVQRPEAHALHHARGVHRYNYSDLPIFDIALGTFENPPDFPRGECGYYLGASARVAEMLLCRDVTKPRAVSGSMEARCLEDGQAPIEEVAGL